MNITFRFIACVLIVASVSTCNLSAQVPLDVWRDMALKMDVGTELHVRLHDGKRFRATLVRVDDTGLLVQPKTRVPVPVQQVPYDAIVSLERTEGGIGAGKAAAIGITTGAGAFWGMLLLAIAMWGD